MGVAENHGGGASSVQLVPRFQLYGEEGESARVDFVHAEEIRSRSERLGWRIEPHTHAGLTQLLVVFEGGVDSLIETESVTVDVPVAIMIPPGVIHGFDFVPGTVGSVVTIAAAWLDAHLGVDSGEVAMFSAPRLVELRQPKVALARLRSLLDHLCDECQSEDNQRTGVREGVLRAALGLVEREWLAVAEQGHGGRPQRDVVLVRRLRELVASRPDIQLSVGACAVALGVSESSLNRACRGVVGSTTLEVIHSRVELEARRQLAYRHDSVSRVAHDLGFADAAYFSRFFRRRTGYSPTEYRRSNSTSIPL